MRVPNLEKGLCHNLSATEMCKRRQKRNVLFKTCSNIRAALPLFDSNVTIAANVFTASSDLVRLYHHVVPGLIYAVQLLENGKQVMSCRIDTLSPEQ